MSKISLVVSKFMELRTRKEMLEEEHKQKVKVINSALRQLESYFLKYLDETGQTSIKTPEATVFTKTNDYAQVADWDELLAFIRENETYEFLEKRVSKNAVRDYIEATKSVPPGVNYGTKISLNVRRA